MNFNLFPKKVVPTKHFKQRQAQRASKSNYQKDLSFKGIVRIVYMPLDEKGNKTIYVFTKGYRQYILLERKTVFLIKTMIQYDAKSFEEKLKAGLRKKEIMERGL